MPSLDDILDLNRGISPLEQESINALSTPSLSSKIINGVFTPLKTFGLVLDTPGSLVRSALAGNLERGFKGIFDPSQRISGTELLGGPKDDFTWSGFGTEIATDPLTYLTAGLTEAGAKSARLSKLLTKEKALSGFLGPADNFVNKHLLDLRNTIDDLKGVTPLADTMAEQAKLGQRSIRFGFPFTEGLKISDGESLFKGLDKVNEFAKTLSATKPLAYIGRKFNSTYGFDPVMKEQVSFARGLERKGEAEAFTAYHKLMNKDSGDLVMAAKQLGTDTADVSRQVLNYIETAYGKIDISGKTIFTPDLVLNTIDNTPKIIKDLGDALKRQVDELRVTGNNRGLFIKDFGGAVGYYPRYVTKEGEKYLYEIAKKHNITLKETDFDDALGVLGRIPGFEQLRKVFRNKTTEEANSIMRSKFGMKGEFFDTDIATSLSRRMINQGRQETKRRFANAVLKIFPVADKTNAVKISKLLANSKAGPAFMSKFYTDHEIPVMEDILSAFRGGEYVDKQGKRVAWQTPDSRKRAYELMKNTIYKYRSYTWKQYINELRKNWNEKDINKFIEGTNRFDYPTTVSHLPNKIVDYLKNKYKDITNDDLLNTYLTSLSIEDKNYVIDHLLSSTGKRYTVDINNGLNAITGTSSYGDTPAEYLNTINNLYHGTGGHNIPSITEKGLLGGRQRPSWGSTKLAGIDEPHTAWSPLRKTAKDYAGSSIERAPAGTEWADKGIYNYIKNKIIEAFPKISKSNVEDLMPPIIGLPHNSFAETIDKFKKVLNRELTDKELKFVADMYKTRTKSIAILKTKLSRSLSTIVPETFDTISQADAIANIPKYIDAIKTELGEHVTNAFDNNYIIEMFIEKVVNYKNKGKDIDPLINDFVNSSYSLHTDINLDANKIENLKNIFENIAKDTLYGKQISRERTVSNTNYEKILGELEHGVPFGKFRKEKLLPSMGFGDDITSEFQFFNTSQVPKELFELEHSVTEDLKKYIGFQLRRRGIETTIPNEHFTSIQGKILHSIDESINTGSNVTIHDILVGHLGADVYKLKPEDIGLLTAYKNAKLAGDEYFTTKLADTGIYKNTGKVKIGEKKVGDTLYTANIIRRSKGNKGTLVKHLDEEFKKIGLEKKFIPIKVYKDMSNILTDIKNPEWMKSFINIVDKSNAVFRGLFTSVVPAYHIRNDLNGKFMNLMAGIKNPMEYAHSYKAFKNLTLDEVEELKTLGIIGRGSHDETIRIMEMGRLNPNNAFMKTMAPGHKIAESIDNWNRFTLFKHELAKGKTALEAADTVKMYHFDYGDLSKFEKSVMRRSVLFYTFMRKNTEFMLKSLFTNPKFMMSYARAVGKTNVNLIEPVWMTDAIFLGKNDKGENRRLSLGLAPADLDKFDPMYKGVERFAQLLFSQLNPLLTQPSEFITGKDLFFDKPIQGSLPERLLSSSPLARLTGIAQRANINPEQEALRSILGLNIRTTPKNQEDLNKEYILKTKLDQIAKSGQAHKTEIVVPNKDSNEDSVNNVRLLNKYIRKLQEKNK